MRCIAVKTLAKARIQIPKAIAQSNPKPTNAVVARTIINRSVRSASPPSHLMLRLSARVLMYDTMKPEIKLIRTIGTSLSCLVISYQRIPPITALSPNRSSVESSKAPNELEPLLDNLAIVPSKRSNSTKNKTQIVPAKKCPDGKKISAAAIVAPAPIKLMALADIPIRIKPRQSGVINLVTGARSDPCSIIPIVGLGIVSDLIFPPIAPNLGVSIVGKNSAGLARDLGVNPVALEGADAAIFIVSANEGITADAAQLWSQARELYIPSLVAITDIEMSEIDFDDMAAIATRLLDPVVTPYLVLHAEDGSPSALIDLDSLQLSDYSTGMRIVKESDPEHKVLVFEFRKEYLEALEEFGQDAFQQGLAFPAIPVIPTLKLGLFELLSYLAKLPSRS
jgi:hypothetical protein